MTQGTPIVEVGGECAAYLGSVVVEAAPQVTAIMVPPHSRPLQYNAPSSHSLAPPTEAPPTSWPRPHAALSCHGPARPMAPPTFILPWPSLLYEASLPVFTGSLTKNLFYPCFPMFLNMSFPDSSK